MTVYDRDLLEAIREIGRQLRTLNKRLEAALRPITVKDLPDLETYFERLEGEQ